MKPLKQKGDTIVEVMLAVMVIALTVSGAYGVASRSLKAARQAQERGEALKLAEGQLETIKGITSGVVSPAAGDDIFDTSKTFCLKGNDKIEFGSTWGDTIKTLDVDNLDDYPAECGPVNGLYHLTVQTVSLDNNIYQYTVAVRWYRVGSSAKDEVKIDYRLYRGAN